MCCRRNRQLTPGIGPEKPLLHWANELWFKNSQYTNGATFEVALVRQVELELQTADDVALGSAKEPVLGVGVHADFERNVMQRADAEGLGVEDFVPAERSRAEQAVDFCRTCAVGRSEGATETGVDTRRSRVVVIRLEQRDVEEIGAIGPRIEMGERVDRLCGLGIDRAVRVDGKHAGAGRQ